MQMCIRDSRDEGKVLRYVGNIDEDGACRVKIAEVDGNDPLFKVKNGENALAFYSPVSYTHLDVYKRQGLAFVSEVARLFNGEVTLRNVQEGGVLASLRLHRHFT